MMIATTAAKIGRSMKKRENTVFRPLLLRDLHVDAPGLVVAAAAGHVGRSLKAYALGVDAQLHERVSHCERALLRELDVVAAPAGLVCIAGDRDRRANAHDLGR